VGQLVSAVGAVEQSAQRIGNPVGIVAPAHRASEFLREIPRFLVNNRFMRIIKDVEFLRLYLNALLRFVAYSYPT